MGGAYCKSDCSQLLNKDYKPKYTINEPSC